MVIKKSLYERRSEEGFHFSHLDEYRKLKSAEYAERTKERYRSRHTVKAKKWTIEHLEESRLKAQIWRDNNRERLQLKNQNRKLKLTDTQERKWDRLSFAKSSDDSKLHIVGCKDHPSPWSQGTSKQNKSMCDISLWISHKDPVTADEEALCTHCVRLVKYWGGTKYLFHSEPPPMPTTDQLSAAIVESFHSWNAEQFAGGIVNICEADKAESIAMAILKLIDKEPESAERFYRTAAYDIIARSILGLCSPTKAELVALDVLKLLGKEAKPQAEKPKANGAIPKTEAMDIAWKDGQLYNEAWEACKTSAFRKQFKELKRDSPQVYRTIISEFLAELASCMKGT